MVSCWQTAFLMVVVSDEEQEGRQLSAEFLQHFFAPHCILSLVCQLSSICKALCSEPGPEFESGTDSLLRELSFQSGTRNEHPSLSQWVPRWG